MLSDKIIDRFNLNRYPTLSFEIINNSLHLIFEDETYFSGIGIGRFNEPYISQDYFEVERDEIIVKINTLVILFDKLKSRIYDHKGHSGKGIINLIIPKDKLYNKIKNDTYTLGRGIKTVRLKVEAYNYLLTFYIEFYKAENKRLKQTEIHIEERQKSILSRIKRNEKHIESMKSYRLDAKGLYNIEERLNDALKHFRIKPEDFTFPSYRP